MQSWVGESIFYTGRSRPASFLYAGQLPCFIPFFGEGIVNKSREFIRHIPKWVKRGLIIKYLPPYSPELNLIEILWRFMKYYWLPFSAYMSFQCLLQSVEDILTRFGTDYTIAFEIK